MKDPRAKIKIKQGQSEGKKGVCIYCVYTVRVVIDLIKPDTKIRSYEGKDGVGFFFKSNNFST